MTTLVPNEVVALVFAGDLSPMRAWREHLGLTGWRVGRSSARGKQIRGQGPLLVRLRGAESEGCKSPPGRRLLPET